MNVPKSAVRGRLVGIVGALSVALAAGAGQACAAPTTSPSASSHLSSAPSASTTSTTSGITSASPCGAMVGKPSTIHKVMVIVMENTTFGTVINSAQAPTINNLATACGLASNFHGIQFPSLPNYIQLTSGTAPPSIAGNGVKGSDCAPSANCQSTDPSVFAQLESAGLSWKSYAESMPSNCYLSNTGEYVPRHNPATYYVNERASCAKFDVPMGSTSSGALLSDLQNGTLPAYSFVAPNMCNDGHDSCNGVPQVVEEDRFMADWLPQIIASPDYQNGSLTVVLTADTSSGSDPTNHLATIVVSPFVAGHTVASGEFNHYSLLRMTEQLTGLSSYLGAAATAPDMLPSFGLAPAGNTGTPQPPPTPPTNGGGSGMASMTALPTTWRAGAKVTLTKAATVSLAVQDQSGKTVRSLIKSAAYPAGNTTVYWHGYSDGPAPVKLAAGRYTFVLTASSGASSQTVKVGVTTR